VQFGMCLCTTLPKGQREKKDQFKRLFYSRRELLARSQVVLFVNRASASELHQSFVLGSALRLASEVSCSCSRDQVLSSQIAWRSSNARGLGRASSNLI
jgi:hypothetical protein